MDVHIRHPCPVPGLRDKPDVGGTGEQRQEHVFGVAERNRLFSKGFGSEGSVMGGLSLSTVGRIVLLAIPVLVAFSIPVVGFLASLILLPLAAYLVRRALWPLTSRRATAGWSVLALVGLWLPALLPLLSQGGIALGGSVVWLLIPLCVPAGLAAVMVPALAATVISLAGAAASVRTGHPWPWVVGAWVSPFAYIATSLWLVETALQC